MGVNLEGRKGYASKRVVAFSALQEAPLYPSIRRAIALTLTTVITGALLVATGSSATAATAEQGVSIETNWRTSDDFLRNMVVSENSGTVYFVDFWNQGIRSYAPNGDTNFYATSGQVGSMAIDQATETVYVLASNGVLSSLHNGQVSTYNTMTGVQLVVDQNSGVVYIRSNGASVVGIFDHGNYGTVAIPAYASAIDIVEETGTLYAAIASTGRVVAIHNGAIVDDFVFPGGTNQIEFAVDQEAATLWASSYSTDTVVEIESSGRTSHAVGDGPTTIAADETTGTVYVYNSIAGTVSVLADNANATRSVGLVNKIVTDSTSGAVYFLLQNTSKIVRVLDGVTTSFILPGAGGYYINNGVVIDESESAMYILRQTESLGAEVDKITPSSEVVAPAITASTPSQAMTGNLYQFPVLATGSPTPVYALTAGTLPTGLTLNSATGVITGTPTMGGSRTFTVSVTANGQTVDAEYTIAVRGFTNVEPPLAALGVPYSFQLTATTQSAAFTVESGTLPAGITLSDSGLLSGIPTTQGVTTFTVKNSYPSDFFGAPRKTMSIGTQARVTAFSSGAPVGGAVGQQYSFTFAANGFPLPKYAISSGSLPAGLILDATTGVVSGSPATSGLATFTVTARSVSPLYASSKTVKYTLPIVGPAEITSEAPAPAIVGTPYSFTVTASGYPTPEFAVIDGVLPAGLALNPTTGVISGTPTARIAAPVSITAFNGLGDDATEDYLVLAQSATSTTLTLDRKATQTFGSATRVTAKAQVALVDAAYPEGEVVFSDGDTDLASVGVNDGTASFVLPATTTGGSHTITARFVPDQNVYRYSTATAKLTVKKATSKTTLTLSKSSIKKNTTTTVTAKVVVTGVANPAGTVSVYLGSKKLATATLGEGGTATLTVPKFSTTGAKKLVLKYAGTGDIAASTAATKTLTVKK